MSGRAGKLIFAALLTLSAAVYLAWRICFTIPYEHGALSVICGWILMACELVGGIELLGYIWLELNIDNDRAAPSRSGKMPDVDVFVPTYGEPVALLERTLSACLAMEYNGRFSVWLLDDSGREEMRELAERLGAGYIARDEHSGAKAGNLNNAMRVTHAPYIAIFDADMAPRKDFLAKTMPYMNKRTAFVQTPQSFTDPDLFQAAWGDASAIPNEQDFFYRSIQPARIAVNAVVLSGSNMLMNREALESVGGFAEDTVTEDFATGIELQKKGWRSAALSETLAEGLSPESLEALIRQRRRWARGCIQSGKRAGLRLGKGLSFKQKLSYFIAVSYWYFPVKRLIYLAAPLLFALGGIPVMVCDPLSAAMYWLPMFALTNAWILVSSGRTRTVGWSMFYETCLSPFLLGAVVKESFGIRGTVFEVTPKDGRSEWRASRLLPFAVCAALCCAALWRVGRLSWLEGSGSYAVLIAWLIYQLYMQLSAFFFVLACRRGAAESGSEPGHRIAEGKLIRSKLLRMMRGALR